MVKMMNFREQFERDQEQLVQSYLAGATCTELAKPYGCSDTSVYLFLKKKGVLRSSHRFRGKRREHELKIRELHEKGYSVKAIMREIGVESGVVYFWLRQMGLSTSRHLSVKIDRLEENKERILELYSHGLSYDDIGQKFSKRVKCDGETIRLRMAQWGVHDINRIHRVDQTFFDHIDTEEKAYVLGLFAADGNCISDHRGIRISLIDLPLLEMVKEILGYEGPIRNIGKKSERHQVQYSLAISSRRLALGLASKGCPPKKTLILKFPTQDIVPGDLIRHWIRGYLDGDGHIGVVGQRVRRWVVQITGTRDVCEGIERACDVKCYYTQRFPERGKDNWSIIISRKDDLAWFLTYIYQDSLYSLHRKRKKAQQFFRERELYVPVEPGVVF